MGFQCYDENKRKRLIIINKICSFFGHRDTSSEIRPALYVEIERHITQCNVTIFYVGEHGRFDRMSVSVLCDLKQKYPHIKICLIHSHMPGKKERCEEKRYDCTLLPDGMEFVPKKFAITHRNRFVVNESDYVIAHVRTTWGGAYDAMQYAKRKKKYVINLADE